MCIPPPPARDDVYCRYCRRQWSLADVDHLRYHHLGGFDRALMELDDRWVLSSDQFSGRKAYLDLRGMAIHGGEVLRYGCPFSHVHAITPGGL
jgi:hypothetical protein